jgi:two-component system LytT family response regulator
MRIKAIIVDDEQAGRDTLEKLLEMYCPEVWVAGKAGNGEEAIVLIQDLKPEIAFLDIVMPRMTGFDILEKCKQHDFTPIFVSAHSEYLLKAIKFAAFDFLLKPVNYKELQECIARYQASKPASRVQKNTSSIPPHNLALPTKEGYHFVNTSEVMYCRADDNYTNFILTDNTRILVCRTLKDCEDLLSTVDFFRSHQSYLINLHYIKKYLKGINSIVMKNGDEIPIAVRKKEEFSKLIEKL